VNGYEEKDAWVEPGEDSGQIYSRLLGHRPVPAVVANFQERFTKAAFDRLDAPWHQAKAHGHHLRYEAAADAYRIALERQPYNWMLMGEVANFLNYALREPAAALEMSKAALTLNPACSAELWNAHGEALYSLGWIEESRPAFLRALEVNPDDVPARLNLAWVYLHQKEHNEALRVLAEALALDWRGVYRERLLQKQAEVLADLARRSQQQFQLLVNRVSKHPGPTPAQDNAPRADSQEAPSKPGARMGSAP
jgi:tetratricopeptide (TPR) repeat protein